MTKSNFAKEQLQAFVSRIERLEEERAALGEDLKEVYKEAEGTGFDKSVIRLCIADRKKKRANRAKRQEQLSLFDLYTENLDDPA